MNDLAFEVAHKISGGHNMRRSGPGWSLRCPAHEDGRASLSISPGRDQPVVLHCHAGCTVDAICAAVGIEWAELCKPREDVRRGSDDWTPAGPAVAIYDYRDERGELLFQVCRTADKEFRQRRPKPGGGWIWQLGDTRRVLYRLPKVLEAVANGDMVFIVEGEKDVHSIEKLGLVATCNPGGAGKWLPEYSEALRDAVVTVIADRDNPGQAHARLVRDALTGIAADITIAEPKTGKDITDHLAAGFGLEHLETTWSTEAPTPPDLAPGIWEFLEQADSAPQWLIPGLLERGDRLVLTGFEGLGKSMLVRQLAICAASGIHPFRRGHGTEFKPIKVLMIDCENSEDQGRRKFRGMAMTAKYYNRPPLNDDLRLLHKPQGINLGTDADVAWLYERVTAHKPDLLVIGPFYKLHEDNMNDERVARRVVAVLDRARAINNSALITEAHAGHGDASRSRDVRPTGSSLLLRWPEFGYGLAHNEMAEPDEHGRCRHVDVRAWRGPRDEREWPRHLRYGDPGDFPWVVWQPPHNETKKGHR